MSIIDRVSSRPLLLIVLPVAIALLCMISTSFSMLNAISVSVDKQDRTRTEQVVHSALGSLVDSVAGLVVDNARWDAAVENTRDPINLNWIETTWGIYTGDANYDVAFVLDGKGARLAGYRGGQAITMEASAYLGPSLGSLLAALPPDGTDFGVASTLAVTADGLAAIAAAPIFPASVSNDREIAPRKVLVFARLLTEPVLAQTGRHYVVRNLQASPLAPDEPIPAGAMAAMDRWGQPVAALWWEDARPGDAARQTYLVSVVVIVVALLLVMAPISLAHFFIMRRLASNERAAIAAARRDSLSNLPNRLHLSEVLTRAFEQQRTDFALVHIDLDGFKGVNDIYDHETGDRLIRAFSGGLQSLAGENALAARLGGDEFAVLIAGAEAQARAEACAQTILDCLREPFDLDGRIAHVGASIGIAQPDGNPCDAVEMMRRANVALDEAKENGKNQWRRFDAAQDIRRQEDMAIASELRLHIEAGAIDVVYQPIVDVRSRAMIGVEALARWPDQSLRKVTPERFVSLAERHGMVDALGDLIFEKACRDIAPLEGLHLSVNLSPLQLNDPSLSARLQRIGAAHHLTLDRLQIEVTEAVMIRHPTRARRVLGDLHRLGIRIALDDFGAGYASLGYLRDFSFDAIKLDRSLTQAIVSDSTSQMFLHGTILIANGLAATVIAEGVETEEQLALIRLAGCQVMQGYHLGRPQPLADLLRRYKTGSGEPGKRRAG